jgi:hypothetical protein
MSKFLSELDAHLLNDDSIWMLDKDLVYQSDLLNAIITVRAGFQTDFASVPRVPIAYMFFGDKAHRESVLHDYLYRIDSVPIVTESQANSVFLEAMTLRGKPWWVRKCMYWGVCLGGFSAFHKLKVGDSLI